VWPPGSREVTLANAVDLRAGRAVRRALGLGLVSLVVLLALVADATAAAASRPGPSYLDTGFADNAAFQGLPPSQSAPWFARAQSIGSSYVRLTANWRQIAPVRLTSGFQPGNASDPGYSWSALDGKVEEAVTHGQRVVLQLFEAPTWALGHNAPKNADPGSWRPSPTALGAFARAVAERYSGRFPDPQHPGESLPLVTYFQAWNEPNLPGSLSPQWTRTSSGHFVPASPYFYRRMLNAVYVNIKAVQPDAYVLTAGTAPYGDAPGVDRMAPVVFVRELLCLNGSSLRPEYCPDPAHFDAVDHHPYSLTPTAHAYNPDDVGVPDLGKLDSILRVAERTGRALPAGPKPIWVTEIAWSSKPPDPLAIPDALQARYLSEAFYELWRQGVSHIFWLLIRDFPYKSLTGSGVYFQSGAPEPSSRAFHFQFVALPGPRGELTLWGHAPHAGPVEIERGTGHGWQTLTELSTTAGGVFYAQRQLGSHLVLRAQIGNITSLPWVTH
jgi:hypothetical protein